MSHRFLFRTLLDSDDEKRRKQKCSLLFIIPSILLIVISLTLYRCGGGGGGGEASAGEGMITLSWDAPTKNRDGSNLTDLAGYWVKYGTSSGIYAEKRYVGNVTTYPLGGLIRGQKYYLTVTAVNVNSKESDPAVEIEAKAK